MTCFLWEVFVKIYFIDKKLKNESLLKATMHSAETKKKIKS